jgi:hypothetical protein
MATFSDLSSHNARPLKKSFVLSLAAVFSQFIVFDSEEIHTSLQHLAILITYGSSKSVWLSIVDRL